MLDIAIALAVFLPYVLGKSFGLLTVSFHNSEITCLSLMHCFQVEPQRAWEILNLPLLGVRLLTDPVVDFIIMLFTHPKLINMLLSVGSFFISPLTKSLYYILSVMRGEERAAEITELWLDMVSVFFCWSCT